MRTIKVLVEKCLQSRYSRNYVEVTEDGRVSHVYWTDQELAIERMKDSIAEAVQNGLFNAKMLEDLADLVRDKAYQDGCDDERDSFEQE